MRARLLAAAPCAALVLACAACSGSAATDPGASARSVAWVDKVCGAMRSVQTAGGTEPAVDQSNPTAAVRGLADYFGGVVTAVHSARTVLKDAGPSPVAGADADVTRIEGELGQVETAFKTARDQMQGVDPADPGAVASGLTTALQPVQKLDVAADPIGQMRKNQAFDQVAKTVPSCSAT